MKMLLIFPPIRLSDVPRNFPTGLGIIASIIRNNGHDVKVLDINGNRFSKTYVENYIKKEDFDVVGIGGLITVYNYLKWLIPLIRKKDKKIPIIIGGGIGSNIPELCLLKLGADIVLDFTKTDVVEEVMKLTNGYGCDVYIHSSGNPTGVINGLKMLRKKGRFVEFSVFSEETSVDWSIIGDRKELDIAGSHISGADGYKVAIDFLERGIINVANIVTHVLPLKEWENGFDMEGTGSKGAIKVVLKP